MILLKSRCRRTLIILCVIKINVDDEKVFTYNIDDFMLFKPVRLAIYKNVDL